MSLIYHLTPKTYFEAHEAQPDYTPAEFGSDGFIHCTGERDKMIEIANQFYKDAPGAFLVLAIDEHIVRAEVRWEDGIPTPDPEGTQFPHIYGPLNRDAIIRIHAVHRTPDGAFSWPDDNV